MIITVFGSKIDIKINIDSIVFILFTSFICSWYILPSIKMLFNYTSFSFFLLVYLMFYIVTHQPIIKIILKVLFWSTLFGVLHSLIVFPLDFKKGLWVVMTQFITFFPFFIFMTVYARKNILEYILIVFAIICMYAYAGLNTYIAMAIDPNITRFMTAISVSDQEQVKLYQSLNVGGFGLSYSIGLLCIIFWAMFLSFDLKKSNKMIFLLFAILFFIYVVNAQFAILFIITLVLIIYILFNKINNIKIRFIALLSLIPIIFMLPTVVGWLAQTFSGSTLGEKFTIMLSNDFSQIDRFMMYKDSFNLFLKSPVWGNDVTGSNYIVYNASHSTFMSLLSSTGILGISFYLISFFVVHKYLRIFFQRKIYNSIFIPSYLFILLVSLMNPTFEIFEFYLLLFLFTPLVCKLQNYIYTIIKLKKLYYVKKMES